MWYRVFIISHIVLLLGFFVVILGDYLLPGLAPYTMPVGALVSGVSVIVFAVAGVALIWPTTPKRVSDKSPGTTPHCQRNA